MIEQLIISIITFKKAKDENVASHMKLKTPSKFALSDYFHALDSKTFKLSKMV